MASMILRYVTLILGAFFVAFVDLVTKHAFFGKQLALFGSFIRIEEHSNYGISFNIPIPSWISVGIAVLVIGMIFWTYKKHHYHKSTIISIALILLIGGIIGNAYDRIVFGYVRDWFAIYRSIFNLADICIIMGMGMGYIALRKDAALPFA